MKWIGKAMSAGAVMMLLGGSSLAVAAEPAREAPEKGTWEYALAMETGNLEAIGTGTFRESDAAPVEESVRIGAFTYRIHIDLP